MIRLETTLAIGAMLLLLLVSGVWLRAVLAFGTRWLAGRLPIEAPRGAYRLLPGPAALLRRQARRTVRAGGAVGLAVAAALLPAFIILSTLPDWPGPARAAAVTVLAASVTASAVLPGRLLREARRIEVELAEVGAPPARAGSAWLGFQLLRWNWSRTYVRICSGGVITIVGMTLLPRVTDSSEAGDDARLLGLFVGTVATVLYAALLTWWVDYQDPEAALLAVGRLLRDPRPGPPRLTGALAPPPPAIRADPVELGRFATALGRCVARTARGLPEPVRTEVLAGGGRLLADVGRSALVGHAAVRAAVGDALATVLVGGAPALAARPGEGGEVPRRRWDRLLNVATTIATVVATGAGVYGLFRPPR
ncbi:hypothetical protein [Micromonospora siamensis]|uniref:Uncharacterized protein n=1 Tax=Micromonospora siamensis TaxID=299152 RepID=A0A1C5JD15_9ACTN|nr:hypothetical protein [Micromonospora siamensis]SCG68408.1 hypothetical protein GA0074704_4377 [Micromonospora siamensis]